MLWEKQNVVGLNYNYLLFSKIIPSFIVPKINFNHIYKLTRL